MNLKKAATNLQIRTTQQHILMQARKAMFSWLFIKPKQYGLMESKDTSGLEKPEQIFAVRSGTVEPKHGRLMDSYA